MNIYPGEFNEFGRKAGQLMSDVADVPSLLRSRLGDQHELTRAAEQMAASIETLVRELRSFDSSAEPTATGTYQNPF